MIKSLEGSYQIGSEELDTVVIITNPSCYINKIIDNINNKRCDVEVIFRDVTKGVQYSELIFDYVYTNSWEDKDIDEWINIKLNEYKYK